MEKMKRDGREKGFYIYTILVLSSPPSLYHRSPRNHQIKKVIKTSYVELKGWHGIITRLETLIIPLGQNN